MTILYVIIIILLIIVFLLALALFLFSKKSIYLSNREKEFIIFVIDIFIQYGDDLGVQSKEQHVKLAEELEKIKSKYLKM